MSDKSWEPRLYECLNVLNNFCFHVYAQNLLSHFLTLTLALSHSYTISISHSITLDMLNKFCFHLYAQKSLFIAEKCNGFFLTSSSSSSPDPLTLETSVESPTKHRLNRIELMEHDKHSSYYFNSSNFAWNSEFDIQTQFMLCGAFRKILIRFWFSWSDS